MQMLAKATSTLPPLNFKFKTPLLPPANNVVVHCRRSRAVVRVSGSGGGFSKRQLETSGAYELIDEESGEKFIVWGDDEYVPSKDLLRWKPSDTNNPKSSSSTINAPSSGEATRSVISDKAGGKASTRTFGRLKALRVRDIGRTGSARKQQDDKSHAYGANIVKEDPVNKSKQSQTESFDTVSWTNVPQEQRDVWKREDSSQVKTGIRRSGEHSFENRDRHKTVSPSRVTSTSSRGRTAGESFQDSRSKRKDSNKWQKSFADSEFFSRKSFKDIGCSDYMIEFLKSQQYPRPSNIQAMAFAPVNTGKSCIIADQSGSGKTLAYLLPVVQRIREEELQGVSKSLSQSPRVVVLVPTAELASQVLTNCRLMSHSGVPFRSTIATGGFAQKTQVENLKLELDVLITTPGRFIYLVNEGFIQLTNLRGAVLDEVDILFNDEGFQPALESLIKSSPVTTQYLFVTATLPVNIYNKIIENFPDCEVVMGPGMHRTSPGLEEILVDCSGDDGAEKSPETAFLNKKNALLKLVEQSPATKMIVFCNKIETCRKVENALKRFDRKGSSTTVLPFHSALDQQTRIENMKAFCRSDLKDSSKFLVCTDRASRGMDFPDVGKVVMFDFPRDPSEYVRRVGRTARAGGEGKAFIFVVGKQVSLARRIIERNQKGHPLHQVPSAYEWVR